MFCEPHPQTFASLQRNTLQLPDVRCVRAAVYPSRQETLPFYSRFAGDGEAGVVDVLQRIFNSLPEQGMFEVPVIHPANLPPADIVKIDTEGAEAAILEAMDLEPVSLISCNISDGSRRNQSCCNRFPWSTECRRGSHAAVEYHPAWPANFMDSFVL